MSDQGYSWKNTRNTSSYLMPKSENFGWWVLVAIVMGVVFHFLLFIALEKVPIIIQLLEGAPEEKSEPAEMKMTHLPPKQLLEIPDLDKLSPPPEDALEVSEKIAEIEDVIDEAIITPEVTKIFQDFKIDAPAISGDLLDVKIEMTDGPELDIDVPELGRNQELLTNPLKADVNMDPGKAMSDIFDPDKFTEQLLKSGADGLSDDGVVEGYTSLEEMKEMTGNALENAKALIGSDLLFEFGKVELKSNARHSLMAVAYLIDKNPDLFCVLNGHTDLFGQQDVNAKLSLERAQAVKDWLTNSLLLEGKRILVVGKGMSAPLIKEGDKEAQALNRRVVIQMKKKPLREPKIELVPEATPELIPEIIPEAIPRAIPENEEEGDPAEPQRER